MWAINNFVFYTCSEAMIVIIVCSVVGGVLLLLLVLVLLVTCCVCVRVRRGKLAIVSLFINHGLHIPLGDQMSYSLYSSLFILIHVSGSPLFILMHNVMLSTHIQKRDAPLISRDKGDAYTYGEDYNVSFRAASSHL